MIPRPIHLTQLAAKIANFPENIWETGTLQFTTPTLFQDSGLRRYDGQQFPYPRLATVFPRCS